MLGGSRQAPETFMQTVETRDQCCLKRYHWKLVVVVPFLMIILFVNVNLFIKFSFLTVSPIHWMSNGECESNLQNLVS